MANLTISIDDELLRRARVRAAEHGTSVNAVLRDELVRYAGSDSAAAAAAFVALARDKAGSSGDRGRSWTRDSLYDDRLAVE